MKRIISIVLSSILAVSVLAACTAPVPASEASSSAVRANEAWLASRLGAVPDNVRVGLGSDLGIDMTPFEADGYLIRTEGGETVVAGKTADGLDRAVRAFAKAYEKGGVPDVTYHEGCRIKDLRIAGSPIADFTVVIPAERNANLDFAVSELVRLVEKACGTHLPTAEESAPGHKIILSQTDDPSLGAEGFTYEVANGDLLITGATERGCMYGVWRFLTNELNWHNLMHGDSVLECADLVDVPEGTSKTETPAFPYFAMVSTNYEGRSFVTDAKTPTNSQNSYGAIAQACHGMQGHAFCEEDFRYRQICYTSEARYDECIENVRDYIEKKLASGNRIGKELKYIDIAQGDNNNFCTCKDCMKVLKEEGSNSGAMLRFANRLSEEINEDYYGIYFQIFGYDGTNTPPLVTRPNEWIYVTFCFDANCTNHKIDGTECDGTVTFLQRKPRTNEMYVTWLRGWCDMCDHVYVWYYALDNCLFQYNIFRTMHDDLRFFRDIGIEGVFWEAEMASFGIQYVEHMVMYELNRDLDISDEKYNELINTALETEFGEGWTHVRRYIDIQTEAQSCTGCWNCWNGHQRFVNEAYYLAHYPEIESLFDSAVSLADSALQEHQAKLFGMHTVQMGAYAAYYDAFLNGDEATLDHWRAEYAEMVSEIRAMGYVIDQLPTLYGNVGKIGEDLDTEVWTHWVTKGDSLYYSLVRFDPPVVVDNPELK